MTGGASPTRTVRRAVFTLVELLVVIALIIVLAALTAAVVQTGMLTSQKVVSAADRASGWLLIAKQRALRDGAPRGVRRLANGRVRMRFNWATVDLKRRTLDKAGAVSLRIAD